MTNKVAFLRPWGSYEVLQDEHKYKVKKIVIHPKERISYQSHKNRRECWIITNGRGTLTLDERESSVGYGSIIVIPPGAKHRIKNTEKSENLVFIEVQTGSSFSEEDITRYMDDYGRITKE